MKFHSVLLAAAMVVFTSGAANAAIVNYGDPITGGEWVTTDDAILNGQSGSIFISPNAEGGGFQAGLPNNSTITFSYTFSPLSYTIPSLAPLPFVGAHGGVNGFPLQSANANTYGGGKYNFNSFDVFATANIDGLHGITSITNHSGEGIPISTWFAGILEQVSNGVGGTVGKINYSVSNVPLPASVVMLGSAVAAMFGFSYLSRQRKDTILQA